MTLYELCQRDVINTTTGENLGRVDDITFAENSAIITHIVLYGRLKLFGLLGRDEDVLIPWAEIRKIGADVLLVERETAEPVRKKRGLPNAFFRT